MISKGKTGISLLFGFTVIMGVLFALPSLGMGPKNPPPPAECDSLTVSCIEWATTGGKGQHIHVQAFVEDQDGNPVIGAVVSMSARRDGVEYAVVGGPTEAFEGLDGGVDCPGGPPGSGVTRDFCVNRAPVGFYDAVVLSVDGCGPWDGTTPENGADFLGKQ